MTGDLADELAQRLLDAHRQIASSSLSHAEKTTASGRLLALSDTAKVDLGSASRRLDRLLADVAEAGGAPAQPADGGPRA